MSSSTINAGGLISAFSLVVLISLNALNVTAWADKTSQVLEIYEYEISDDAAVKEGELKSAKDKYDDLLKEINFLNSHNANIESVNADAIIAAKAEADRDLLELEEKLMCATDLSVSAVLALESEIKQLRAKCSVLAEEVVYVESFYEYTVPEDQIGNALDLVATKAKEYDEAVRYGEIGYVTNVHVPLTGNYRKTSDFGVRINPLTGYGYDFHSGLDLGASTGTGIGALFSGTVIVAEWHYGMGNYVRIDHGDGIISSYLHMSRIDVKVGDKVQQYEKIGEVGGTGQWSTGPHLHLALSINGTYVDPARLFNNEV